MKYCSQCAAPLARRVPPGDALPRHVCDTCGVIHYENPKMIVGCVGPTALGWLLYVRAQQAHQRTSAAALQQRSRA